MGFSSGGAETLVRNLSREFTMRGHQCHVLAVAYAADLGNSTRFEQEFRDELSAGGISFTVLGSASRKNPAYGALSLRRAIKAAKPDIMHVHTGHGLLFQALGMLRVPSAYTHHNIRLNFPPKLFKIFDVFVDRYVAISRACEAVLRSHVRKPVELIFNGVPSHFKADMRRTAPSGHHTVLSVGALTGQKDYPVLIRAAALCVRHFADQGRRISFRIAGGGPEMPLLRRTIVEEGVEDHVELLGTRSDIPDLMAQSDLLANSSLYEGLPLVLIEAAMSGLPAVATNVGGNPEVVADGVTGLLVPAEQPEALANGIIELLSDPDRYGAFSAAAIARSEKFTIAACADRHLSLYSNILNRVTPG